MAFNLGDIFLTLKMNTDAVKSGLADVQGFAAGVQKTASGLQSYFSDAAAASQKFAVGLGVVGAALGAAGGFALKSASDYQQNSVAFETMLGSASKAQTLLKQVSDFAAQTPFDLPSVVDGSKHLLAFGVSMSDIIPTFTTLGNIAAGVGTDKLPQLINVFGQVKAAGRLMSQDLLQFTSAGVPILDLLGQHFDKTTAQVRDMVQNGQVSFDDLNASLQLLGGTGGKWGDLMAKQSMTFQGTMSNLGDQVGRAARQIMGIDASGNIEKDSLFARLIVVANDALTWLNANVGNIVDTINTIVNFVIKNGPVIAAVIISGLIPAFIAWAAAVWAVMAPLLPLMAIGAAMTIIWEKNRALFEAIVIGLGTVAAVIGALVLPAVIAAATAFGAMAVAALAAFAPFIIIGVAAGAIAYAIISNWQSVQTFFKALWQDVQIGFQGLSDFLVAGWNAVASVVTAVFSAIWNDVIKPIVDLIVGYFTIEFAVIAYVFDVLRGLAIIAFQAIYDFIKPMIDTLVIDANWLGGIFAGVWNWILSAASGAWNGIVGGFSWAWGQVSGLWNGAIGWFNGIFGGIGKAAGGLGSTIANAIGNAFNTVTSLVRDAANWVIGKVDTVIRAVNASAGKLPGVPQLAQIPQFARGVQNFIGGLAIVGEKGPELLQLPGGSSVFSNGQTSQMLAGAGGGGGDVHVHLDGANITSPQVAMEYAEMIGNQLIHKLEIQRRLAR